MIPIDFQGHMFKGQCQTTLLSPLCCPLNIFWPLHLINKKVGVGVPLNEQTISIDFQGHVFKGQGQTTLLSPLCCPLNIICPFTWSIPNLVQGLRPISRWSLLIFRSHVSRSRSNYSFEPNVFSILYSLIPCVLASDRFCFYREDKPEFCSMGSVYVSETFLILFTVKY